MHRVVREKIGIGILIDKYVGLLWEYRILEKLVNSDFAVIKLVIKRDEYTSIHNSDKYSLAYQLHEKLDKFIFRSKIDYDTEINILSLIKDVQVISFSSLNEERTEYGSEYLNTKLLENNIDVILNFGAKPTGTIFPAAPKYGVWSYNVGDNRIIRGYPTAYWEIVKKIPEIGGTLSILPGIDYAEKIICRVGLSTYPNSMNVNRNQILGLANIIIPRIIKGLFLYGNSYFEKQLNKFNSDIELNNSKVFKTPSSFETLKNLSIIFIKHFFRKIFYLKTDYWFLLYHIYDKSNPFPDAITSFKELKAPKGKFWADPFVVSRDNKYYVFVEEYLYKTEKAHISVLKLDERGILLSSERIIEKPYHMSYPYIFEFNNKYYMIPETCANNTIELYCCIDFPYKWEFVINLIEPISAVDSTLFFHDNKWWLFTSVEEKENGSTNYKELFLYFSDDLFSGNWHSHPSNPIITDIKSSRPAGKIFSYNNKIYRPSQDCSGRYGKAFNINQITILNEFDYEEVLLSKIEPNWNRKIIGTHTFNFDKFISVMDVYSQGKRISFGL
jgi:hypothetical protein